MRGNYFAGLLVASFAVLLAAGACHSSQRISSPSSRKHVEPIVSAKAAPGVLAPHDAGTTAAGVAPWDGGGNQPLRVLRSHEAAQEVVERLLGDDLVQAKKVCSYEPPETRETCIDAALKARTDELEAKMLRNARALELLQRVGNADCAKVPRLPAKKQETCILESMNRHLVELDAECPSQPENAQFECQMEALIRRFGP